VIEKYNNLNEVKLRHVELQNEFKKMSETELADYNFLSKFIYHRVGLKLHIKNCGIKNAEDMKCWGGLCSKQFPDELGKFLVFIYKHKDQINSYCEIGPFRGGTFFVIDSFLRAINPNMEKSLAVDIKKTILKSGFHDYQKQNPQVDFILTDSLDFVPDQKYDLCLIDGNHTYKYIKHDYENMKKYVKFLALHDIYLDIGKYNGVKTLWKTLNNVNKIEFLNEDDRFVSPVGIGVIINE
jgi:hypothetical protein